MNKETLQRYFSGKATEEEQKIVIDWYHENDSNKKEFLEEKVLWDLLLFNEPDLSDKIEEPESVPAKKGILSVLWKRPIAAAAVLLGVIIGGALIYLSLNVHMRMPAIAMNQIDVPAGQRIKVVLPDSSIVWLNAKSKFSYPVAFDKDKRVVQLDGEGYFEVVHNPSLPFKVVTPTHTINVLGTVFNVNAYRNSNFFEATLVSGSVRVDDVNKDKQAALLKPGEKFSFNKTDNTGVVNQVNPTVYTSWKEGLYQFNDVPFSEMIRELEYYKNVKITVADTSILSYKCTGKFRQEESIREILDVVQIDLPISYELNTSGTEILIHSLKK